MATPQQIADLRQLIDEATSESYTDQQLSDRLDASTSVRGLASVIWAEKAARYSGLVDVKEGSSDRKLSQLYKNALEMSRSFAVEEDGEPVTTSKRPARTRRIVRT